MQNIGIYYIGYIVIKNIHSVNPRYLIIVEADGYIEESNVNKYLILILQKKN